MKAKFLTLILVSTVVCFSMAGNKTARVSAGESSDDSTLSVIAWFAKGDTMKYRYVQEDFKIKNDTDTLKSDKKVESEFMLVVKDSTSNGYIIEFIPGESKYGGMEFDDKTSQNTMSVLNKMFSDVRAVFSCDEYGTITGIENWKEIRDKMSDGITLMLDSMYKDKPDLDSVMPRQRYEQLMKLVYSSEKGIMSAYDEMTTLFGLHGKVFNLGTTTVDTSAKDSTVITVFTGYEAYDDYSFEDDYTIAGKTVQKLTKNETVNLIGNTLGVLMEGTIADKVKTTMRDSMKTGATVTRLEDYNFFYNGWPCAMRTCSIVELADIKVVKQRSFVWTYRSWNNYETDAVKPEGISM